MSKVLFIANLSDGQTGEYIANSFGVVGCETLYGIDIWRMPAELTPQAMQELILKEVDRIPENVDIVMVLKGLNIKLSTLKKIRDKFPEALFVNWFFDKYCI